MSATAGTAAWWTVLERFAAEDRGCDSAVGCLLGLTLGDAVGAPLEFCAAAWAAKKDFALRDVKPGMGFIRLFISG